MSSGHKSYVLAAENDQDLKEWLSKLSSVLQQNRINEEKRAASLERGEHYSQLLLVTEVGIGLILLHYHSSIST